MSEVVDEDVNVLIEDDRRWPRCTSSSWSWRAPGHRGQVR